MHTGMRRFLMSSTDITIGRQQKLFVIALFLIFGSTITPTSIAAMDSKPETHEFGTDPSRYYLPKKVAINTTEIPNIVLKASDRSDSSLPYYKLRENVYMFFGNFCLP